MPKYTSIKLPIENVFRDPVHNYIYVEEQVILDLINSKEFQRLRRIKQLGTTSFTFHGGEHTRFSHSLGVYEIARKICDLFDRNYSISVFEDGWNPDERLVLLVAALLHDIGHGAYSHTFETIFHTNHEDYTVKILLSPETEVNQILTRVHPDFPDAIASVITKTYPNPQVVQLISSQVDADRMDYLLRDAYFTGTEYGTFDLTRILRVIRPYKDGIAFQMNGMHAVEDYIVSRYQMYMQVYFHPVSRGMEVILDHLLKRGKELFQKDPSFFKKTSPLLLPFFEGHPSLHDYMKMDDGVLTTYFSEWEDSADSILNDLAKRFMNRHPFKSAKFTEGKDDKTLRHLTQLIEDVGFDTRYYTAVNTSFDLPYDFYRPEKVHPRTQIELIEKDGSLYELSTYSDLVHALAGEQKGDERFYFPREMLPNTKTQLSLFDDISVEFGTCIKNGALVSPENSEVSF